jgi:predicted DNA-binding transcriptional regulator YafY
MKKNLEKLYFKLLFCENVILKEFAKEVGVSLRTVQNYIKELKSKYKIVKVKAGVYKLIEKPSVIEESLFEHFKNLVYSFNLYVFNDYKNEIKKIFNLSREASIVSNIKIENFDINKIKLILYAINEKFMLYISYKGNEYAIQPVKIGIFDLRLYLFAEDLKENKIKTFHINSIESFNFLEENYFYKDLNVQIKSKYFKESKQRTLIKVKKEFKNYFEKEIFELEYHHINELVEFVKKHLTMIEIIDEKLKAKVKELLLDEIESL